MGDTEGVSETSPLLTGSNGLHARGNSLVDNPPDPNVLDFFANNATKGSMKKSARSGVKGVQDLAIDMGSSGMSPIEFRRIVEKRQHIISPNQHDIVEEDEEV
jgi:hypothetical protein